MIPEYQYRVVDDSIATPYFKKWLVAPLFNAIMPWGIPANIITIISNLFVYGSLFLTINQIGSLQFRLLVSALSILIYTIGDHMDGMQAKRTKTSSALGEFFDHFLDIFNNGILVFIVCTLLNISQSWIIAFLMLTGYLSHAAIFYEQSATKWLYFGKIGALETVIFMIMLLLLALVSPVYYILTSIRIFNLSFIEVIFIISSFGAIITYFQIIYRVKIKDPNFYIFCLSLTIIAILSSYFLAPVSIFTIITLYSGIYIGNLQRGHLADGKKRITEFITPLVIVLMFSFDALKTTTVLYLLYGYLFAHIIYITIYSIYTLRSFWVWCNPKL